MIAGSLAVGFYGRFSTFQGNFVGTNPTQTANLANLGNGVSMDTSGQPFTGVLGGLGPGEGNVIAHNGLGGTFNYPAGFLMSGSSGQVTARGNRLLRQPARRDRARTRSAPRGGSRRPRRRAERAPERARADGDRLRAADRRALRAEQRAVDDVRRGLLRQHELRDVSGALRAGRGARRKHDGDDQRVGHRRDRLHAALAHCPGRTRDGHRHGSLRQHVGVLAGDPAEDPAALRPGGRRQQRSDVRAALRTGRDRLSGRSRRFEPRRHAAELDHGGHAGIRSGNGPRRRRHEPGGRLRNARPTATSPTSSTCRRPTSSTTTSSSSSPTR